MNRNQWIGVVVALAVVGYLSGNVLLGKPTGSQKDQSGNIINSTTTSSGGAKQETFMDTTTLKIEDQQIGGGAEAVPGKHVYVHYVGRLTNGTVFDSSISRGKPIDFDLGVGYVIKGWDEGLKGMKVGGKRRITVPPSMGYGANDYGPIPGNSTLVFDVELVDVK